MQNTVAVNRGLCDIQKLILTVLKTSFDKNKSCKSLYRDYVSFNEDLQNILSTTQINICKEFECFEHACTINKEIIKSKSFKVYN